MEIPKTMSDNEGFPSAADDSVPGENQPIREYSNHQDQLLGCAPTPERLKRLEEDLLAAFSGVIEFREVAFIRFGDLNAEELAAAFIAYPLIVKPTLCCVNVGQRAIKRDLGYDLNTYSAKIDEKHALLLAGYIKPLLPPALALPALLELDRFWWTDKKLRARKGNWEKAVTVELNRQSDADFRKRMFICDSEEFEIDAAYPPNGEPIKVAVDIKRIESPRDIHKRADEIINKATKFKKIYPESTFVAVVYYPFPNQHINVQSRLHSQFIDDLYFAAETSSSIESAVDLLLGKLYLKKK